MFRLALRSLWCDLKHSLKGIEVIGLAAFALALFLPLKTDWFMFLWLFEVAVRRFMPICEKIYFALPLSEGDRARLLRYRTEIIEAALFLMAGATMLIRYLIYGQINAEQLYPIGMMLFMMECFWAAYFCGYFPEASMAAKAWSVTLGVVAGAACAIVVVAYANSEPKPFGAGCLFIIVTVCFAVIFLIKLYFMTHAHYEEYRLTGLMYDRGAMSEKKKEQEW